MSEKRNKLDYSSIANFRRIVRAYYIKNGRHDLPWRATTDPYRITVSEVMLQQTQVPRVIEKYKQFLKLFPTIRSLAAAPLPRVLAVWSGLGYNRRAKFLHHMAQTIVTKRKGIFPKTVAELELLPGIGPYTARAIASFAYNEPTAFIETNIRTVYFHHFFPNKKQISDTELLSVVQATMDRKKPREWYAALMDYGTYLKGTGNSAHRNSVHYTKQSRFAGSRRQLRGAIIRMLLGGSKTTTALAIATGKEVSDITTAASDLMREKMIEKQGQKYALAGTK